LYLHKEFEKLVEFEIARDLRKIRNIEERKERE
jgi:hypothetical protein